MDRHLVSDRILGFDYGIRFILFYRGVSSWSMLIFRLNILYKIRSLINKSVGGYLRKNNTLNKFFNPWWKRGIKKSVTYKSFNNQFWVLFELSKILFSFWFKGLSWWRIEYNFNCSLIDSNLLNSFPSF